MSSSTTKKSTSKKASQKKADPKQQFTLFPKLPLELRCKVWKYAFPGPRYIEIRSEKAKIGLNYRKEQWSPFCTEKAPTVFFVCKESRAETLRSYKALKGTQVGTPAIYCDFERDVLCIISKCFNYAFFPEFVESLSNHANSICHILTDGSIFGWMLDEYFAENFDALIQFSSLKEISLVSYLEEEFQNPDMNFVEDELFTIYDFKNCSSEDPHKSCMGIVREFYGKAIASKRMCLANEGIFEIQMMKEGFTRAEKEHPGWKAPFVNCGLLIFVDQRGVRWAKCHGRWRCSADERISIRPNVEFENDCRADEFECGPYHNIKTPEFDMRLSSQHFPCKHNTYYSRDTL